MRILILSQYFYPENFKGNDIAFDFQKAGHEVTVLTGKPNYPQGKFFEGYSFFSTRKEIIKGVNIIRVPLFPRLDGSGKFLILNYFSFLFFSFFAVYFRLKDDYDVVFTQSLSPMTSSLPGVWIKKRFKIPHIIWILDLWPESVIANSKHKEGIIINILNKLVAYIYKNSDKILVSSLSFKKSIISKFSIPNIKIEYFPNWAEDVFTKKQIKNTDNEVPNFADGFNILFAGNVGDSQDFEAIIKAAEQTKNTNIIWNIVGDGRKKTWIEKEIKRLKLANINLLGRFPLESMPAFFNQANSMLVSLKDDPAFTLTVPAKIQAYMASGKIILGMINGEGNQLINNSGAGICVSAGDYQSLAKAAISISLMTNIERTNMEQKSLSFYNDNFSKYILFEKLENIFNDSVN